MGEAKMFFMVNTEFSNYEIYVLFSALPPTPILDIL
jgi:hypothetical protein